MSKIDQKQNWVKLKSVQTLPRIACLANMKSYVVIIYANLCDKSEIGSSPFKHCSELFVLLIGSYMWSLYVPIHLKS